MQLENIIKVFLELLRWSWKQRIENSVQTYTSKEGITVVKAIVFAALVAREDVM